MRTMIAVAAAALLSTPAWADDDCKLPLQSYGTVPLTMLSGQRSAFVPVEIAGVPKLMLLDTGASITMMKTAVVNELKLTPQGMEGATYDLTGGRSTVYVTAPMTLGGMSADKFVFVVGTPYLDQVGGRRAAGLLGANFLKNFDVSIDFAAQTFALLNQNHCDGKVVYWPERPIAVVPFELKGDAIIVKVELDGHTFRAQLDTGAYNSTLERSRAEGNFDLKPGSEDTPAIGDMDGKGMTVWKHRFQTLSLDGIAISNPEIEIIPDKISTKVNAWSTGSMLDRQYNGPVEVPMLLGMNVLRQLHVYIAYKERKLYITPVGPAPASAPTPLAATKPDATDMDDTSQTPP
jgi:hypothetical protein